MKKSQSFLSPLQPKILAHTAHSLFYNAFNACTLIAQPLHNNAQSLYIDSSKKYKNAMVKQISLYHRGEVTGQNLP